MTAEGFVFPRGFASKFRAYTNTVHWLVSGVGTRIQIGTIIDFDSLNEVDAALYQFVPLQAGYYYFRAALAIANLNVGDSWYVRIIRNAVLQSVDQRHQDVAGWKSAMTQAILYVTPNDAVSVEGWHNSGVNRQVVNGVAFTSLEGFRVA